MSRADVLTELQSLADTASRSGHLERLEIVRDTVSEMLEALTMALPYITDAESFPEHFEPGVVAKHVAQVRAAIAKATGEQP